MPHSVFDYVAWGALLLAAVLLFLLIMVIRNILLGIRAKQWPYVIGQLLSVEDKIKGTPGEEDYIQEIVVRYAYQVDGQEFEGKTIHPCYGRSNSQKQHDGLKAILAPGVRVRVYYSPLRPKICMLSPGYYSVSLAGIFGVLLFFVGMLIIAFVFWNHPGTGFAEGIKILP